MKTVILCGGFGTRLSEETHLIPKPMVQVGELPILHHIMNIYSHYGHDDFVLALGFKAQVIKEYFLNFYALSSDLRINLKDGSLKYLKESQKNWQVDLIETGKQSMTGGRLARLKDHIGKERFMLTYGDGVTDLDINKLIEFHESHGKIATFTAVHPPSRFGVIQLDQESGQVASFQEKPQTEDGWISGGFFVFEPEVFDYLKDGDATILERNPLETLAQEGQLMAYKHKGFWQCMDTLRDKNYLNTLWESGDAPWAKN